MASQHDKKTLASPAPAGEENVYSFWTEEEHSDKRGLRFSIAVAAVLHLVLLTVTFPQVYSQELGNDVKDKKLFLVQTPRFKQLPPPVEKLPEVAVTKIPVPDPDPDKLEAYVPDLPPRPTVEYDIDTVPVFTIPGPPPPPPAKDVYVAGGDIAPPERIAYVKPLYTEIARVTRTEGLVILKAIINKDGDVINLEVLKGQPMGLTEEAMKAVRQWRYKPSTVDGRPVNVMLTVSVSFQLQ